MTDAGSWVCGNCRSINPMRSGNCYSCRSPRSLAIDPTAPAPPKTITDESPLEDRAEIARRAGASYQSTAQQAWLARLAVVVATIATLGMVVFEIWALRQPLDAGIEGETAFLSIVARVVVGSVWLASFVAWGWWLSRVVANVPALGGGWTGTSPGAAFISAVVPVSNLVWGTAVLRDAMVRLSPRDAARTGLLTMWWISLVLAILPWVGALPQAGAVRFVFRLVASSLAVIVSAIPGLVVSPEEMIEVIAGILIIVAAALAISLVDHVEDLQETRVKVMPELAASPT